MSSTDEIWEKFHLERNCVRVTDENRIRLYFAQFSRALEALDRSVSQATGTTSAEARAVDHYVRRLRHTFEALALRHFYAEDGLSLKIDSSDSGFFHFSTLVEVAADQKRREAQLAELPAAAELKRRMLEDIVERAIHPRAHQKTMLRRLYLEHLAREEPFASFLPGKLEMMSRKGEEPSYFWSFATYDRALNRPFIYLLYFTWEAGRQALEPESDDFAEIRAAAERTAAGRLSLLAFSSRLDEMQPRMRPRIVKRLILGPYCSPLFTRDDGAFGALLDGMAERLPFALLWEAETLISERETRVGAGWLSKGQLRQVFWIPRSVDLAERGVSQLERFALLPHWLAQHVQTAGLLADHHQLVIGSDEKIHGLD